MKTYFKRPWMDQYWCKNANGDILLINFREEGKESNRHYNGDAHIFLKKDDPFDQDGAKKMTQAEWLIIRDQHIARLKAF